MFARDLDDCPESRIALELFKLRGFVRFSVDLKDLRIAPAVLHSIPRRAVFEHISNMSKLIMYLVEVRFNRFASERRDIILLRLSVSLAGSLHLAGLRTALYFNHLTARRLGGKRVLRSFGGPLSELQICEAPWKGYDEC